MHCEPISTGCGEANWSATWAPWSNRSMHSICAQARPGCPISDAVDDRRRIEPSTEPSLQDAAHSVFTGRRRPMHQPPLRQRVVARSAVLGCCVVPDEKIAHLPAVSVDELRLLQMREQPLEESIAIRAIDPEDVGRMA